MTPDQLAEYEDFAKKHNMRPTPDALIEHARRSESLLHSLFEWDVEKAALMTWRNQARHIITSVRYEVVIEGKTVTSVAYVEDPTKEPGEQGYVHVSVLRNDRDMAKQVALFEFARAENALKRAREVSEVLGIRPDLDRLSKGVDRVRRKVERVRPTPSV